MAETRTENIERLSKLINGIDTCMLTTMDGGVLRSRPMSTQKFEFDGDLWFFTSTDTHKVEEIEKDSRVNVSYAAASKTSYVSVSGRATLLRDQAKIDEYWEPSHKLWFPDGKDDPKLILLKVEVEQAEYWDFSTGIITHVFSFLKTMVTGAEPDDSGDSTKITL
jgi:general stress protein 26